MWHFTIPIGALALVCLMVLLELLLDLGIWAWIRNSPSEVESGSTTIRNLGLLFAGVAALVFAYWRSKVADRQANLAQQTLLNERYQRGAEMLGNKSLSVRIGGIYALEDLAREFPELYHVKVMRVFCSFARYPHKEDNRNECMPEDDATRKGKIRRIPADVEAVMHAIGQRGCERILLEQNQRPRVLYLRNANLANLQIEDADLSGAWLTRADLSHAVFPRVNLSDARLRKADLSHARLREANLSGAKLWGTNLSRARLHGADLSGTDLCGVDAASPEYRIPVSGLTQKQLDEAIADADDPPKLDGVIDHETGKPLEWRDKARE